MKRTEFRYLERLRVRWAEIDAQKIVFNGHYLMYFDTAVAGYWRALAVPYVETMAAWQGDMFVRKATLDYLGSARYDDLLDIALRCDRIGSSSARFVGAAFRGDECLVTCELVYVYADAQTQRPQPVPAPLRALFEGYEAGQPVLDLRLGTWSELGAAARVLRTEVFVDEQKVPAEMEWDAADATALHALASNRLGLPLATGRLLQQAPGVGRIGRMAVSRALRGTGVGRAVLDALVQAAAARGDHQLLLHAQVAAIAFYERAGFALHGPVFEEAGIAHREMVRKLLPELS